MSIACADNEVALSSPYKPYGACETLLFGAREPEVLIAGPSGTGKSYACLMKLSAFAAKYAGARCLIVRKTRASCTESVLVTFEDQVLTPTSPILRGARRNNRHSYLFPNGSEVIVGGMDTQYVDRVMSTEYDIIYAAEATDLLEADWEKLTTRLGRREVVPYCQIIGCCNPNAPTHWLYQRCQRGGTRLLESRHEDNPLLYDHRRKRWTGVGEQYLIRLDHLTGVRKERLRYGRWVTAEGVVYDGWDSRVHLIDRFTIPAEWRRIRAIDFGYTNPFVCLWIAVDPDDRMYVYRYIYRTQQLVEDHAKQIITFSLHEAIEATVADHDAEDNATLKRRGIHTRLAGKEIGPGIEAVAARLRPAGDGCPRLFVLRDSLVERDESLEDLGRPWTLEQEFDVYRWPRSLEGRPVRETPVDVDNHALDALRYAVRYVDVHGVRSSGSGEALSTLRRGSRRDAMRSV